MSGFDAYSQQDKAFGSPQSYDPQQKTLMSERDKPSMSEVELVKQLNARASMTERLTGVKGDGTRLREAADTITRLLKERDEARAERDSADGIWPEWAQQILERLRERGYQYDAEEEIQLPDDFIAHVEGWLQATEDRYKARAEAAEAAHKQCECERDVDRGLFLQASKRAESAEAQVDMVNNTRRGLEGEIVELAASCKSLRETKDLFFRKYESAEAQVAALREAIGKKLTPKARELLGDLAESMTMMRDAEGQPLTLLLQWYDESRKALEASR